MSKQDARLSYSALGKRIGLSLPAVAERVRKLEAAGIITGYHATVNLAQLGISVQAIIQVQGIGGQSCTRAVDSITQMPEVLECYRLTGSDGVIVKAVATSLDHLARVIDQLSLHGIPTTSIVRSRPMQRHTISHQIIERGEAEDDVAT